MLPPDHQIAGEDSADQSAPEHESRSAEQGTGIAHQYRVVSLTAEESAYHCCENEVANWFGVVSAARELPLGDDLRHHERE